MSVALAQTATEVVVVKKAPKLGPSALHRADHARSPYRIQPAASVEYADILAPIYWHHIASKLRPGDIVEVWPEDRAYFAMLVVVAAEDNTAKVEEIVFRKFDSPALEEVTMPVGYGIDWRGPNGKFAVVRNLDKQVIQSGFVKKDEAIKWLVENRRTLVS